MAPDDAADPIAPGEQERRLPILNLLPEVQQRKVRSLLSYNPETAGGLMSPDFLCLPESDSVANALAAIHTSTAPPETLNVVFAANVEGSVVGSVSAVRLIQGEPTALLGSVVRPNPAHVHAGSAFTHFVRKRHDGFDAMAFAYGRRRRTRGRSEERRVGEGLRTLSPPD